MHGVLENASNMASLPRQSGLLSTIFRAYRNHFGLFWRVMLPVIVLSLIFKLAVFLLFKFGVDGAQWSFSTSQGISAPRSSSIFNESSGTSQPSLESTGVRSGRGFSASSFTIGFLWLTMCPLILIIRQHRGTAATFREVWRQTLRKTWAILSGSLLASALTLGIGLVPISLMLLMEPIQLRFPTLILLSLLIPGVPITYFLVKWSLYNQGIIVENLSAIAAFRRSSALVRGVWGRFFSMYLLLALGTTMFTTAVFSLTLLLFSVVAPEFAALQEVLQSKEFFTLFFGGYVQITLESVPIWAVGVMSTVSTLIHAILAPIWALLTTHLYIERAGIQQNAVSH